MNDGIDGARATNFKFENSQAVCQPKEAFAVASMGVRHCCAELKDVSERRWTREMRWATNIKNESRPR